MAKTTTTTSTGIGLSGLVFIVFLVFKLAEIGAVAKWSWWWVTSPLWIPLGLLGAFLIGYLIVVGIVALFSNR